MFRFLVLATVISSTMAIGRTQSAGVKGILKCDDKLASKVLVKLYDDDSGIDSDDLLASGKTDSKGYFELSGHTDEIFTIDAKVNIYHDCNDGIKPCQRKFTIKLPNSYVSNGKTPKKFYDVGVIQLAGKFPGEERDCFHL